MSLPFSSIFPPRFSIRTVHKSHHREKYVNHTGIMLLPGDLVQFIVKLISVFADQIFWVMDVDCTEITSNFFADIGEVLELGDCGEIWGFHFGVEGCLHSLSFTKSQSIEGYLTFSIISFLLGRSRGSA